MPRATPSDLAAFLHYGFLPRVPEGYRALPWARVRAREVAGSGEREALVKRGLAALRAACAEPGPGLHVVPLSGGVDSRCLLAVLSEAGLGERLVAATFGIPGTYDFDLAPAVARAAGVRHEAVDLARLPVTRAGLLAAARRAPWCHAFEAFYNHQIPLRFGPEATYWSGIMANAIAGVDQEEPASDWPTAQAAFAVRCRIARNVVLTPPDFDPCALLPERPLLADSVLSYYEQLFAFLRYPCRLEPALLPAGFRFRTPFRQPAWVDFLLRAPRALRRGQALYHAIARRTSPALFALPAKNNLGLPLSAPAWRVGLRRARLKLERAHAARFPGRARRVNPKLNTIDFDRALRAGGDVRQVVEESLQRLAERRVLAWLDPLALLRRHLAGAANLGEALALLAAVELNLTVEEEAVEGARA
ncbi:MAG TPA: hypothetical protein VF530_12270 [Planctomycetota bacterium]